jgi:hypothetical protein
MDTARQRVAAINTRSGGAVGFTEDPRGVTADHSQEQRPETGDLTTARTQGLGPSLLILEQALALFDVPRDDLTVRHPAILRLKCAPNKTRGCRMCVG